MAFDLILASTSRIRSHLLSQAGIHHRTLPARIDEATVKLALIAEGAPARDIADTLAELKARKIAEKEPASYVLGCDQTLSLGHKLLSKPATPQDAADQLAQLQANTHHLHAAVVLYENARPVWRHVAEASMTMRPLSADYIAAYVARNWPDISHSVGGYLIEAEGIALFSAIAGEYSTILGLPMPPLIGYLASRGLIAS